jgi:hypothetical protein
VERTEFNLEDSGSKILPLILRCNCFSKSAFFAGVLQIYFNWQIAFPKCAEVDCFMAAVANTTCSQFLNVIWQFKSELCPQNWVQRQILHLLGDERCIEQFSLIEVEKIFIQISFGSPSSFLVVLYLHFLSDRVLEGVCCLCDVTVNFSLI